VDVGRYITPGTQYPNCTVYSSLDAHLPAGTVDKPENLDLVNYVNTHFNPATHVYTLFDGTLLPTSWQAVQGAIWQLIDNSGNCATGNLSGLSWNASQCTQIANDALAHGNGFVPKNGDRIKFLVSCYNAQTTAIVSQVTGLDEVVDSGSLLGSDTAWALRSDGTKFTNSKGQVTGWGKFFSIDKPKDYGCSDD